MSNQRTFRSRDNDELEVVGMRHRLSIAFQVSSYDPIPVPGPNPNTEVEMSDPRTILASSLCIRAVLKCWCSRVIYVIALSREAESPRSE